MVESTALLKRHTRKGIGGSNPPLTAIPHFGGRQLHPGAARAQRFGGGNEVAQGGAVVFPDGFIEIVPGNEIGAMPLRVIALRGKGPARHPAGGPPGVPHAGEGFDPLR